MATNRILTTTRDDLMPMVVDTILNSNVFATRALANAKKWTFGEKIKMPIKYAKNTTGTSFSGFDLLSTNATENRVNMEFDPKFFQITASVPLTELSVNDTEQKVIDLASIELQTAAQDAADDIGTLFWGNGTGNGGKDFLGLGAIVDDGSTVATIGGLSRSTYPTLQSTVTASGGTLSLQKIRTLYNAISSGNQKPTTAYGTKAVFGFYEALLQPQERIAKDVAMMKSKSMIGGTGFDGLFFGGVPLLADEKCTTGQFVFLNENYIQWYALPMAKTEPIKYRPQDVEGNDYGSLNGLGFSWSNWIKPSNQAALVSHIYLGGQLTTNNPKRHGKLTGITGV